MDYVVLERRDKIFLVPFAVTSLKIDFVAGAAAMSHVRESHAQVESLPAREG